MAGNSSIEWTESTWNPVTGCTKVSEGCKNCYAEAMAKRLVAMKNPRYINGFNVTLHHDLINKPLEWKKPRKIFVNSMSDLFHEDIPLDFIKDVFEVMNKASHHNFQVLTKRPHRVARIAHELNWSHNIWMGTSIENEDVLFRLHHLKKIPAAVRFLSCEPLLGPLSSLNLDGIHWVIVGGESGIGARPMKADWVREIRDQCEVQNVAFFFKQWGGVQKHRHGRLLDDKTYDEFPEVALT
ncbi:bacteriophage protein gp37 [Halalkalibacter wakoensis JCM 9140]|uniref:Bacteriophage protein gp37 n=1 Tax=Halalkalibacter wakoensis JCM 9140 TaxID=1236970 RepID=W4Q4J2_9BACI|nr:phage Gp37/Gp68 family protein [Halalkalibacter wakoensis]GAE26991.1 bacteriophage protein gp37 [Halalkalibacter wakoensis JCM 9140]